MPIGVMLIGFSIFVFVVSTMKDVNKFLVGSIIAMDILWVAGTIVLLAIGAALFTHIGLALIAGIALIVGTFAFFQTVGLYRHLRMCSIS